MKMNKTDVMILTAVANRYGSPSVSEIYADLPTGLFSNKRALSARLCEMRGRTLLTSKTLGSGINEWQLSEAGRMVLRGQELIPDADISPDISAAPEPVVSEPIHADSADISPDIYPDMTPRQPWLGCSDEASPNEVSDDLVEEANALRLRDRLPRIQDALYVMGVLIDRIGRDYPAMAYELTRIAAYIEDAA